MTTSAVTVTPDMELTDSSRRDGADQIRRLPVMKGDELVGIISLGDVAVASSSKRTVGEALDEIVGVTLDAAHDRRSGPGTRRAHSDERLTGGSIEASSEVIDKTTKGSDEV